MGKKPKSTRVPVKIPKKKNKKQIIKTLLKILRPKVYITNSSNFKTLVQQLTGDGNFTLLSSSSPVKIIQDHAYQENSWDLSFNTSGFSTAQESSLDLQIPETLDCVMENSFNSKNIEFPSYYGDTESLLLEMDPILYNYDACYAMI
ncbi:Hypothetical predicted protein [Olea europaea subsp. europaea]|uniref:VQ domain-containing protein n=1 Tax=Olea europaea subsp. europaea TaxID=158383 RepID=A0A8S0QEB4_OLEEU|nr:Hypothetical predicted protein [Olea europaea subsp. europaea]